MTLDTALSLMDMYYSRMRRCTSTQGRKNNGEKMYEIATECPEVEKYWIIDSAWTFWEDRFQKKSEITEKIEITVITSLPKEKEVKVFEDGINYEAPAEAGLYMVGETHFDPTTDDTYYMVKIGKSSCLRKRMSQYNTSNPMLWRIGYYVGACDREEEFHRKLKKIAYRSFKHNNEWMLVDRETYLALCEQGFDYFEV